MAFLKNLFGRGERRVADSESERLLLAKLLVKEIQLYNQSGLAEMRGSSEPPSWFVKEIRRAYEMYVKSCGSSPEARTLFEAEAASALTEGRLELVRAALGD